MSKSQDSGKTETEMHRTVGPMGRRNFIRAAGAGAGVVAVGASPYSPVRNAQAIPPLVLAGAAGGVVAGAAIGYATRRVQEYLTGDDFDEAAYDGLSAEETHALIREMGMSMAAADDSALTNLSNVLDLSKNAAYTDAQAAAVEQMDLGATEAETATAAEEAITEFYVTQQQNLLDHAGIQHGKLTRLQSRIVDQSELDDHNILIPLSGSGSRSVAVGNEYRLDHNSDTDTVDLLDSSTYTYTGLAMTHDNSDGFVRSIDDGYYGGTTAESATHRIVCVPIETGSQETVFDATIYRSLWDTILDQHDTVVSDISAWITSIYPEYESGDIPLENLVTSSQFAASAAEETGYAHSAADLGMLGVPLAEGTMVIELPESDATVEGTLSARNAPEEGFTVGETYDPANISGPVWMAYNYENEAGEMTSDVVELNESFRIVSAQSLEGESLDTVTMRSRNQRTLETDIDALNEELRQLVELQMELQEMQRQEAAGGADGSGDDGADLSLDREIWGVPLIGWGVGALAALAAIMRDR